jgi:Interferon-induced transmembrane protein
MSYPPGPYEGSPEWQGQQPDWQGQQPGWPGQPPGPQGQQPGWQGQQSGWPGQPPGPQGQQPGWQGQQPDWQGQQQPDNYLVWAILSTIFCCLPFGIVSIIYSTKVTGLWAQGQYAEALAASNNAKKWAIIAAIVGPIISVILTVMWFVLFAAAVVNDLPSTTTTTYSGY